MWQKTLKLYLVIQFSLTMVLTPVFSLKAAAINEEQFNKFLQTIESWRNSQASGSITKGAWEEAIRYYFSSQCKGSSCGDCLMGVADLQKPIPRNDGKGVGADTKIWIGNMEGPEPYTIIKSIAASNWKEARDGRYHLVETCGKGGSSFTTCNAQQCCYGKGQGKSGCHSIKDLRNYENLLNEPGGVATVGSSILKYFIHYPKDGGRGLHDADYCMGNEGVCGARTAGCVAHNPAAQKRFCTEVYNPAGSMTWTVYHPGQGAQAPSKDQLKSAAQAWFDMGEQIRCSKKAAKVAISDPNAPPPKAVGEFSGDTTSAPSDTTGPTPSGSESFNDCQQMATTSHIERTETVAEGQSPDAGYKEPVDEVNQEMNPDGTGGKMLQAGATQAAITNCHATNTSEVRTSGGMAGLFVIVAAGGLVAWLAMSKDDKKSDEKAATDAQKAQDQEQADQYAQITSNVPDDYMISPDAAITATAGEGQTVDNQAALSAGELYQESLQYKYEQAKRDKEKTIVNLNQSGAQYSESEDKQAEANSYQNVSSDMAVASVESYEDVYENRVAVMSRRLNTFPTPESVTSHCSELMGRGNILNQDAYKTMTNHYQEVTDIPELDVGNASQICEGYIARDGEHLFKNQQVREQLGGIIDDSVNVLQGLDELKSAIKDQKLSPSERANILKNHPVLKTLGDRFKMLESCERNNCWNNPKSNFRKVGDYLGPVKDSELNRMNNELKASLEGGMRLQTKYSIKDSPKYSALFNRAFDPSAFQNIKSKRSGMLSKLKNGSRNLNHLNSKLVDDNTGANVDGAGLDMSETYYVQGSNNIKYVRDQNGLLRNAATEKPVEGFEASAHEDLFKIISKRYQKKFFQ